VYDLGGGTFDVVGHNGANFLGGKNLDWEIVDKVLGPKIAVAFKFDNFHRDNKAYQSKYARLKFLAERAKMELSQYETTTIEVDGIGEDDESAPIYLSVQLTRQEFEELMDPLMNRTIDLCKQTLKEGGLTSSAVSKVILVGGPTQFPYLRRRLQQRCSPDWLSQIPP
jgi:molecular chaperone DnaK